MIRGIHHVALHTPNFERMAAFYRDAFGFEPVTEEMGWTDSKTIDNAIGVEGSSARVLMLKAGNCYLELFEYFTPKSRESTPPRPSDHGYTHFCVDVTDIEEELVRLAGLGMTFPRGGIADFGVLKMVYGQDIEGNVIEIQELSPDHPFSVQRLEGFRG